MELDWAFPNVECNLVPLGGRVIVQLRRIKRTTSGGIVLPGEVREHEKYKNQVAKVISHGPLAFRKKDTMEPWVEGVWAEPNDFVLVPQYNGSRFEVPVPNEPDEPVVFMLLNDHELIAKVKGDPLSMMYEYVNR